MKKILFLFCLFIFASGLCAQQNLAEVKITGKVFSTDNTVGSNAIVYILDFRHEKLLAQTITNDNGEFVLAMLPGRYNAYVNGELVQNFLILPGKSVDLSLQVQPYVLKMPANVPLFIPGVSSAVLFAVIAAVGAAGIAGGVTYAVSEAAEDDDDDDDLVTETGPQGDDDGGDDDDISP